MGAERRGHGGACSVPLYIRVALKAIFTVLQKYVGNVHLAFI